MNRGHGRKTVVLEDDIKGELYTGNNFNVNK